MTLLPDYHHFDGRHWETGTICNALAYQGVTAPHTGLPYSEALLLGASGGVLMGYFSFAYHGHDPHVALLSRNTFAPVDTMLSRLGIVQHRRHANDAARGLRHLRSVLEEGLPALVWADAFSLPYTGLTGGDDTWANFPILVYGHDSVRDRVWIADRAAVGVTVTQAELETARARVKKDRFRILTIDPPDPAKLAGAVRQGIEDCLARYVTAPVKNAAANFGLAAFEHWAALLTTTTHRQSWSRVFTAGASLYAGLTSAYDYFGIGVVAAIRDRALYADFLDEAGVILNRPSLAGAADAFRACVPGWQALGEALLPDRIRPLGRVREILDRRRALFVERGGRSLVQRRRLDDRLAQIRGVMEDGFPLSPEGVRDLCADIAAQVRRVGELEREAYVALKAAMAGRGR
ncbi:MAG TPA: BtrH N-terminal domain-containing protein [Anaerolineales bacterium]|nr:BtrH N-terminal domain-containing protein [Anaerolineales bacterium]HRF47866.1 BtrH N-terminal domain-containing protein [Anaerolineales bacterium]